MGGWVGGDGASGDSVGGDGVGGLALSSPASRLRPRKGGSRRGRSCSTGPFLTAPAHWWRGGSRLRGDRALAAAAAKEGAGAIAKAVGRFGAACCCACATSDMSTTSCSTAARAPLSRRIRSRCRSASSTSGMQLRSLSRAARRLRPHRISAACTFSSRGESGTAEHACAKQRSSRSSGRYVNGVQGTVEACQVGGASGKSRRSIACGQVVGGAGGVCGRARPTGEAGITCGLSMFPNKVSNNVAYLCVSHRPRVP